VDEVRVSPGARANAVALVVQHGFPSVALPLIGAGAGGMSQERVEAIMVDEFSKWDFPIEARIVVYPIWDLFEDASGFAEAAQAADGACEKARPVPTDSSSALHRAIGTYRITSRICESSQAFDAKSGPSGIFWPDCTPFCAPKKPKKSPKMCHWRALVRDLEY
jgi:hypothetical protein